MAMNVGSLLLKSSLPVNVAIRRVGTFKSAISLDKLYPESVNVKPFTPPISQDGNFSGFIPMNEVDIIYSRSSGAGGQHVNKINTKVDLRFHVATAKWLNEETRQKILNKHLTKINKDGFLVLKSEKTRFQHLNLADAMTKLRELIYKIEEPEPEIPPETLEKMRKNQEKAARIRLMEKREKSLTKRQRQSQDY